RRGQLTLSQDSRKNHLFNCGPLTVFSGVSPEFFPYLLLFHQPLMHLQGDNPDDLAGRNILAIGMRTQKVEVDGSASERDPSPERTDQRRLPRSIRPQNGPVLIRPDLPEAVFQD